LNWSKWIPQTHRWVSIVFTVAVIINGVTVVQGDVTGEVRQQAGPIWQWPYLACSCSPACTCSCSHTSTSGGDRTPTYESYVECDLVRPLRRAMQV
jgi:hypothetical protein